MALLLPYWTYRYAGGVDNAVFVSASLLGLGLMVTALTRIACDEARQDVATLILGLATLLSPLVLGFTDVSGAKGMHTFVGLIVVLLTGLRMAASYLSSSGEAD